jgi:hypothetical protein
MKTVFVTIMIFFCALSPVIAIAQDYSGGQAPIAQPLVREGTVAVRLVEALNLGTTSDEVEAENLLLAVGIAPRDGWISDYPVTPDIVSELRDSVIVAADAGTIALGRDEAAQAFDWVLNQYNLMVTTDDSEAVEYEGQAPAYPDSAMVDDYYYDYGPPPVTYYAPPTYYSHLYSWVSYPFWGWNVWYPGFFVLADFHRFIYVDKRVCVVSNHFFDKREHRYNRIDARERHREFHGKRFDGDRDHRRHFVNKRVVGPSEVRREVEKAFISERNRVRFDADRGRTNFKGGREVRGGTRELKRENKTFNSSGRRAAVVAPSERNRYSSGPAERSFRQSSDRGGHRELKSAPRTFNSRHISAVTYGRKTISSSASHRGFSPSFKGVSGGRMGGSFGGFGRGHRR